MRREKQRANHSTSVASMSFLKNGWTSITSNRVKCKLSYFQRIISHTFIHSDGIQMKLGSKWLMHISELPLHAKTFELKLAMLTTWPYYWPQTRMVNAWHPISFFLLESQLYQLPQLKEKTHWFPQRGRPTWTKSYSSSGCPISLMLPTNGILDATTFFFLMDTTQDWMKIP